MTTGQSPVWCGLCIPLHNPFVCLKNSIEKYFNPIETQVLELKGIVIVYFFYHTQTKLREGNVFAPVCQSFCSQGEGSLYNDTSCLAAWSHVPLGGLSLVTCSFQGSLSRGSHWQRPSWTETPLERNPLRQRPPKQRTPWTETALERPPQTVPSPDRDASYWNAMHTCLFSVFNLTTIHHCGIRALFVRFLKLKAGQTRPNFN